MERRQPYNNKNTIKLRFQLSLPLQDARKTRKDIKKFIIKQGPNTKQKKQSSMTRKYYNHTLQTNPPHHEEVQQNNNSHKTPGRQTEKSNQLSLPHQDNCKTRKDTRHFKTKHGTHTEPLQLEQQ